MRRLLSLCVLAILILAVPTTASACQGGCDIEGWCYVEPASNVACVQQAGYCYFELCFAPPRAPRTLSEKWQIATVEVERSAAVEKLVLAAPKVPATTPESPVSAN